MKKEDGRTVKILSQDVLRKKGLEVLLAQSNWNVVEKETSDIFLADFSLEYVPTWKDGAVVLALVQHNEEAQQALEKGAQGVLHRQGPPNRIPDALCALERGLLLFDPRFRDLLFPMYSTDLDIELSRREQEVLALMAEGLSNKEISRILYLSVHTIKLYVQALLKKLNASSRTEAAVRAVRLNLV